MKEYILQGTETRLRYHDFSGEGTPIVFLHGLGCAGSYDYPNVATQAELAGHRRILVDMLGAGYSDKPANFSYTVAAHAQYLAEFVEALGLKQFYLFGHSLGGAVALVLSTLCEEKICGIVISEANLDKGGGFFSRKVAAYTEGQFAERGFEQILTQSRREGNEIWAASLSVWSPLAVHRLSVSAVEGEKPSWRDVFYQLSCPRTFLFSEEEFDMDEKQALEAHGILTETVADAGHSMAWDNPQGLAAAIARGMAG